jgi:thioredoxin reductase (NADPH)
MMILADAPSSKLTADELEQLSEYATCEQFEDGDIIFNAGDDNVDVFVVEVGALLIINPNDNNAVIAMHEAGNFSGDIDVLTRRPIVVTGIAQGKTRVLRIPNARLREVITRIPRISDKLLTAFQLRREKLLSAKNIGHIILGPGKCRHTTELREFMYKNFVPFTWYDPATEEGRKVSMEFGHPTDFPHIRCTTGKVLTRPTLHELAVGAGVWRHCPDREVDLAIVGAGPAGVCAGVYAASEGLSTLVLDRLGPGGQAGGSSRIENFMGFPAGITGADLATRGVLQMLKFGAQIVAPVLVKTLQPAKTPGEPHELILDCGASIKAKVILIATGVHLRRLDAEGADRYERQGVYYACTTVEALLHDNEDVAVVGAGNSAGQAAIFLSECCPSRKVHLIVRGQFGPSMSDYLSQRIRTISNIRIYEGTKISAVQGGHLIESATLQNKAGETTQLDLAAVFVFIGSDPSAEFLPATVARDDQGFVLTGAEVVSAGLWPLKDRAPCPLETTIPGVLAAGDIRSSSTKRVGFAVGDGSLAVSCAHRLISLIR